MARTVTIEGELEINATRAALDARNVALARNLAFLREQRDSPSNREAVDLTIAAIRDTTKATLHFVDPEDPEPTALPQLAEVETAGTWGRA